MAEYHDFMKTVRTVTSPTARVTVDLPEDDYVRLKIAAASDGRGETMSRVIRALVHDYLEAREDAADLALVAQRAQNRAASLAHDEVLARLRGEV
jgi:Arc/MetJ-type ribon-helix-helix transcriptional regulator